MMAFSNDQVGNFYDATTMLWEKYWGEHLHHGYYDPHVSIQEQNDRQAQVLLIDKMIEWAHLQTCHHFLDVGCGVGGSSLELVKRFGGNTTGIGISLSSYQVQRAESKSRSMGYGKQLKFLIADALNMPFPDHCFDLVWSLESAEHMADKTQFLRECYRVLQPQGRLIMATWCHRQTEQKPLTNYEQNHLQRIYSAYCLPWVISLQNYYDLAQELGFQNIQIADWTREVAPFWHKVWQSALTPQALLDIIKVGLPAIRGALTVRLMIRGYAMGLLKFGLLTAVK
jgi:tocopherol O-methyltransferase